MDVAWRVQAVRCVQKQSGYPARGEARRVVGEGGHKVNGGVDFLCVGGRACEHVGWRDVGMVAAHPLIGWLIACRTLLVRHMGVKHFA
jgi:hypothetical protein